MSFAEGGHGEAPALSLRERAGGMEAKTERARRAQLMRRAESTALNSLSFSYDESLVESEANDRCGV